MFESIGKFIETMGFCVGVTGMVITMLFLIGRIPKNNKNKNVHDNGQSTISSLKTFIMAVAGGTGMGTIAGAPILLQVAGPGSCIWVVVVLFLCRYLRFTEVYLSHKHREVGEKVVIGGPFKYLGNFAFLYAICFLIFGLSVAAFEVNQVSELINTNVTFLNQTHTMRLIVPSLCVLFVFFVIIRGIKGVSNFFAFILPILGIIYVIMSGILLYIHHANISLAFDKIFSDFLHPKAILGGGIFGVMIVTMKRVLTSNETGLGTLGIAHSNSSETNSWMEARRAMNSSWIPGILFLLTMFLILVTDINIQEINGIEGANVVARAFKTCLPSFDIPYLGNFLKVLFENYIAFIFVPILGLNVTIGYSQHGMKNMFFLFGLKRKFVKYVFEVLYLFCAFLGGIYSLQTILPFLDNTQNMLIIVNVLPIIFVHMRKIHHDLKNEVNVK